MQNEVFYISEQIKLIYVKIKYSKKYDNWYVCH